MSNKSKKGHNDVATLNYVFGNPEIMSMVDSVGYNLMPEGHYDHKDHNYSASENILRIINDPNFNLQYMDKDEFAENYGDLTPGRQTHGVAFGRNIYLPDNLNSNAGLGELRNPQHALTHELFHLGDSHGGHLAHSNRIDPTFGFIGDQRNIDAYKSGQFFGPDPSLGESEYKKQWMEMHHGARKGTIAGVPFEGDKGDLYNQRRNFEDLYGLNYMETKDSLWNDLGQQVYGEGYIDKQHLPFGDSQYHYQENVHKLMKKMESLNLLDTLSTVYEQRK